MDNSSDGDLWRRLVAGDTAGASRAWSCLDELTLASYVDGRAGTDEVEAVERHLGACAACRRAVVELREILGQPATVMVPAQVARQAGGLVSPIEPSRRRVALWWPVVRWVAVAAAVLVVGWGGFTAGRKTHADRRAADAAVIRQVSFDDFGDGDEVVASVDAFDEMLLASGGDAK